MALQPALCQPFSQCLSWSWNDTKEDYKPGNNLMCGGDKGTVALLVLFIERSGYLHKPSCYPPEFVEQTLTFLTVIFQEAIAVDIFWQDTGAYSVMQLSSISIMVSSPAPSPKSLSTPTNDNRYPLPSQQHIPNKVRPNIHLQNSD